MLMNVAAHPSLARLLTLLAASLLALASCIHDDALPPVREYVQVGDTLPRLSLTLMDGTRVSNERWQGRTLVLVLFSIQCSDCQHELPEVERFHQMTLQRDDVYTLGISRDGGQEAVSAYWRTHNLTFPCSPQSDAQVYHLFASSIVPRIYIVSPQGRVIAMYDDTSMPQAEVLLRHVTP